MKTSPKPKQPDSQKLFNQKPRFSMMKYLDMDVVEAAKGRIRWAIEQFDDIVVSFSGGKDSLVVLTLVESVYREMGINKKIIVKFMDEELVTDDVIAFVRKYAESGRYEFRWYALEMYVGFFCMGKHHPFVSWDKAREWHRQPPPYAITDIGVNTREHNENTINQFFYPNKKRTVGVILGLRSAESMKRYLSVNKHRSNGVPNWVAGEGGTDHVFVLKPIYDWSEVDVFKWFHDEKVEYCRCYDIQTWARTPLRVSSAMHERATQQFLLLKTMAPLFYQQIRALYPEIETHFRYYKEMDQTQVIYAYHRTFDGIRQYIDDSVDESHKDEAHAFVNACEGRRKMPGNRAPLGSMPVRRVFLLIVQGRFIKQPATLMKVEQADIDYENGVAP